MGDVNFEPETTEEQFIPSLCFYFRLTRRTPRRDSIIPREHSILPSPVRNAYDPGIDLDLCEMDEIKMSPWSLSNSQHDFFVD